MFNMGGEREGTVEDNSKKFWSRGGGDGLSVDGDVQLSSDFPGAGGEHSAGGFFGRKLEVTAFEPVVQGGKVWVQGCASRVNGGAAFTNGTIIGI